MRVSREWTLKYAIWYVPVPCEHAPDRSLALSQILDDSIHP